MIKFLLQRCDFTLQTLIHRLWVHSRRIATLRRHISRRALALTLRLLSDFGVGVSAADGGRGMVMRAIWPQDARA